MKHLGLELHCLHALKKHKQHLANANLGLEKAHQRLTHMEGRIEKKEEHTSLSLQQIEKLHKKLKDSVAQLKAKKEDLEDFTYKVENWDRRMESYISYMNESNAENYGKLIEQQDQLWQFERILKEHQEKTALPDPLLSNLEERIDGIIEILEGDIKREEARDLRLESLEKQSLRCQETMSSLSDCLESMGKELGFLYDKLHEKDATIEHLRNSLESLLSAKKEPMKETFILLENKENSSLMENKKKISHTRVKSSLTQNFIEHPDKKKSNIPKVEVNLDFQSHNIQKPTLKKK